MIIKKMKMEINKKVSRINEIDQKYLLLILLFFSVSIILLSWGVIPGGFSIDDYTDFHSSYKPAAVNIIHGEGYTLNGQWFTKVPPGFPLIIAFFLGFFGTIISLENAMAVMVLIFSSGTVVLLFLLGKHLWGKFGGFINSFLWITYPIAIYLHQQPNSEIPFIFFILLSVYFLVSSENYKKPYVSLLLSGAFVGVGMLIRPIAIGLGIVFSICYLLRIKPKTWSILFGIALILIGNLIIVSPWEYLTYKQTGKVIPLSSLGIESSRLGFTFPVDMDDFREPFSGPDDVVDLAENIYVKSEDMTSTNEFFKLLTNSFRSNPLTFTKFIFIKLLRPWYGTDSGRLDRYILIIQVPYFALILSSIFWAIKNRKLYDNQVLVFLLPVFYFWGMTIVGMPLLRYLLPIFPLFFLLIPVMFLNKEA